MYVKIIFLKQKLSTMAWPRRISLSYLELNELIEGGGACGGCHNMGVKSEAQKQEQAKLGYRYQNK